MVSLKKVKRYRSQIALARKISYYNIIRDRREENGEYRYNSIIRLVATLCSKYYTYIWERWYD